MFQVPEENACMTGLLHHLIEFHWEDELVDLCVDFNVKSLFGSKSLSDYWSNVNTISK